MIKELTLANGDRYRLRAITPTDKAALTAGLHRLSEEAVHRRFLSPKTDFTRAELRYLTEVDGHDHVAIVATPWRFPQFVVADGRYVRLRDRPDTAEVAIVVADELQGRGLGRQIGLALADRAREEGIERFEATMLGDNVAAHRLMATITARVRAEPIVDGAHSLTLDLAA